MPDIEYAAIEDDAEDVPEDERCIWPGCTRRRAPGRVTGSGRQKEYCLKADRPATGGGPVHNARNRWARQRRETGSATGAVATGKSEGGDRQSGGIVQDKWPVSTAKQRAGELLEQARRQHAAALAAFTAERELYTQVAEQFRVIADPASRDLEITAISLKAGRDISAAGEEVARAQRGQLTAERERDDALRHAAEADAAAEQCAEDTEAAERAAAEVERLLADRTAEFGQARRELEERASDAEAQAEAAAARAVAAETAANQAVADARARAAEEIADAREQAALSREEAARAREEAAGQVKTAQEETRDARRQADVTAAEARREVTTTREEAERARRDADKARHEADKVRQDAGRARDDAQAQILAAKTVAATANARAAAVEEEIARLRDERAAEVARLETAHRSALEAERARAQRAEAELDALRQA